MLFSVIEKAASFEAAFQRIYLVLYQCQRHELSAAATSQRMRWP